MHVGPFGSGSGQRGAYVNDQYGLSPDHRCEFGHDVNLRYGVTSKVGGFVADQDMRGWALKGAEQRLVEMAQEAKAIYAAFPELREGGLVGNGRRPGRPRNSGNAA